MSPHSGKLVPITRAVLKAFYSNHPFDAVPEKDTQDIEHELGLLEEALALPGNSIATTYGMSVPSRLDDCFWRSRQVCEEAAYSLTQVAKHQPENSTTWATLQGCAAALNEAERAVFGVQQSNTEAAASQIKGFLPQDFRGALLESKRTMTEAKYTKQVDDLLKKGGSIRDRYELYLRQQWERREALVQMGNLSGMFRIMVKYIGGVPQVLLDFAKEINAPLGPMEEQRLKYGPDFYRIVGLGIKLNVTCAYWAAYVAAGGQEDKTDRVLPVIKQAADFYCHHLTRLVKFLGKLFTISPFFITEDAAKNCTLDATSMARVSKELAKPVHNTPPNDDFREGTADVHCADALLAAVGLQSTLHSNRSSRHSGTYGADTPAGYSPPGTEVGKLAKTSKVPNSGSMGRGTANPGHVTHVTAQMDGPHSPTGKESHAVNATAGLPPKTQPTSGHNGASVFASSAAQAFVKPNDMPSGGSSPSQLQGHSTAQSATSGDFMSCVDNMSWVSSISYQRSLVEGDSVGLSGLQSRGSTGVHMPPNTGSGHLPAKHITLPMPPGITMDAHQSLANGPHLNNQISAPTFTSPKPSQDGGMNNKHNIPVNGTVGVPDTDILVVHRASDFKTKPVESDATTQGVCSDTSSPFAQPGACKTSEGNLVQPKKRTERRRRRKGGWFCGCFSAPVVE